MGTNCGACTFVATVMSIMAQCRVVTLYNTEGYRRVEQTIDELGIPLFFSTLFELC